MPSFWIFKPCCLESCLAAFAVKWALLKPAETGDLVRFRADKSSATD